MRLIRNRLASTLTLAALAMPGIARADSTRIAAQIFVPTAAKPDALKTLVASGPGVGSVVKTAWDAARGQACDQVTAQLPQIVKSYHPSAKVVNAGCDFSVASSATVTRVNTSKLEINLVIPRNTVGFKVEAKQKVFFVDVIPDARIDVPFDMTIKIVAHTAPGMLLQLDGITAAMVPGEPTVQAQSMGGGLVLDAAKFLKINVPDMIRKKIGDRTLAIGQPVEAINRALSGSVSNQIAQAVSVTVWHKGDETLFVLVPHLPDLPRGPVGGTITADVGAPDCGHLGLQATAQGPGKLSNPYASPPAFVAGPDVPSARVTAAANGGAVDAKGVVTARRQCSYHIANAPLGGPSLVEPERPGSKLPARVPSIAGDGIYHMLPASNVNFTMGWGISADTNYLESRFPGQKTHVSPGETNTGGIRVVGQPGIEMRQLLGKVGAVKGVKILKTAPIRQR